MAYTHTILNRRDVLIGSDRIDLPGTGAIMPYVIPARGTFTIQDQQIGPTMQEQIDNGILEITATAPSTPLTPPGVYTSESLLGTSPDLSLLTPAEAQIIVALPDIVPAGAYVIPTKLVLECSIYTNVTGVTVPPQVKVGTNNPTNDNFLAATPAPGLDALHKMFIVPLEGIMPATDGTPTVRVVTAVVATVTGVAPVYKVKALLYGYFKAP